MPLTVAIPTPYAIPRRGAPTFADVCDANLTAVYRYLLYMVRERELAEDLTSETFERALRAWPRFDPRRSSPLTWLTAIGRNVALDHIRSDRRRLRRERRAFLDEPPPTPSPDLALAGDMTAALGRLSDREREVIALRVVLELDRNDAARVIGITPSNCATRLNRALARLREEVSRDDESSLRA